MTEVGKMKGEVTEGRGCLSIGFGWGNSSSAIYYLGRRSRDHFKSSRLENRKGHRWDSIKILKIKQSEWMAQGSGDVSQPET